MAHSTQGLLLPPLDALPAVLAAARAGSFSAAAVELGLTHSAVSRRVKSVEVWLGTDLFERRGRGVDLTPAGHRFTQSIEQAFEHLARFAEQYRPGRAVKVVRVSAVPSFARLWLIWQIARLQGDPTDMRVDILAEHRVAQLESGEADVAIRYGQGPWSGVQMRPLPHESLAPAVSLSFAAAHGLAPIGEMSAAQIARLPLLHDSDLRLWRAWFDGTGQTIRPRTIDRRFEDYDMMLAALEAGLGAGLLRLPIASRIARNPNIVTLSQRTVANPSRHFILVREGEQRPHVLRFVDRLKIVADEFYQGNIAP